MSAHLDQDVRDWASRYVEDVISLDELRAWFASVAWAYDDDLVDEVALLLAEHSSGDLDDDELRRALAARIGRAEVIAGSLPLSRGFLSGSVMAGGIREIHGGFSWFGVGDARVAEPSESEAQPKKPVGA